MNLSNILSEIEKMDPEVYDRLDNRRSAMQQFTKIGGRIALTAVPFALGGMFKKAYAGTGNMKPSIVDVLNFALTLEYLEAEFYTTGVSGSFIANGKIDKGFMLIRDHEQAHVQFLQTVISSLGGTPVSKPTFDFTAGGAFSNVFTNVDTFYAVSQTFEDTGVRAYKGQAANLMSSNEVLTAALQIHSVEARHASFVRSVRSVKGRNYDESIRPWITGDSTAGVGSAVQATYAGEDNTNQLGVQIVNINGFDISMEDATEAFDEPLSMDQVLAIVAPFIVK